MSVWAVGGLEPEEHWRRVCELADELLAASPERDWTVILSPSDFSGARVGRSGAAWDVDLDEAARELRLGVPAGPEPADESEPYELATHIVFDLLLETLYERAHRGG